MTSDTKNINKTKKKDSNHVTSLTSPNRSVKEPIKNKSRSITPQRVFKCTKSNVKTTKIPINRKPPENILSSSTRNAKSPPKFIKTSPQISLPKMKKKPLLNLESFKVNIKKKESKKDKEPTVHKTLVKQKKKKKPQEKSIIDTNNNLTRERQRYIEHVNTIRSSVQQKIDNSGQNRYKSKVIYMMNESKSSVLSGSKGTERMTILDIIEAAVIIIQKSVRGYLCRKHLGTFLQSILNEESMSISDNRLATEYTPHASEYIPIKPLMSDIDHSHTSSLHNYTHSYNRLEGCHTIKKDKNSINSGRINRMTLGKSSNSWEESSYRRKADDNISDHNNKAKNTVDVSIQVDDNDKINERKEIPNGNNGLTVDIIDNQLNIYPCEKVHNTHDKHTDMSVLQSNRSQSNLKMFAKDQYIKWHQVDKLLHKLNSRLNKVDTKGANIFFKQIEELACTSKYGLKNKYKLSDRSSISISETQTIRDEHEYNNNNHDIIQYSIGTSLSNNNNSKKSLEDREIWPDIYDIQSKKLNKESISRREKGERDNDIDVLFDELDSKMDKMMHRDSKPSRSHIHSNRDHIDMSDSVLRSSIKDVDNNISSRYNDNRISKPPHIEEPPSPISNSLLEFIPRILQKTKSKKYMGISSNNNIDTIDEEVHQYIDILDSIHIEECIHTHTYIDTYYYHNDTYDNDINIVLQTIIDDINNNDGGDDSNITIRCDSMWNIDTPTSTDRDKKEFVDSIVHDVIHNIIDDMFDHKVWKQIAIRNSKKLEDKFKEIDELLCYEDSDIVQHKHIDDNIVHNNMLDELEISNGDQSEAETVYGIRTNFNAVEEYLKLLTKFLKERISLLNLPHSINSPSLILKRVHNIEHELKDNRDNNITVKHINITKRPSKKDTSHIKCFKLKSHTSHILSSDLFTLLEEEILVYII